MFPFSTSTVWGSAVVQETSTDTGKRSLDIIVIISLSAWLISVSSSIGYMYSYPENNRMYGWWSVWKVDRVDLFLLETAAVYEHLHLIGLSEGLDDGLFPPVLGFLRNVCETKVRKAAQCFMAQKPGTLQLCASHPGWTGCRLLFHTWCNIRNNVK